jgi:hypothetical protein
LAEYGGLNPDAASGCIGGHEASSEDETSRLRLPSIMVELADFGFGRINGLQVATGF